jgi:hypothetical protein
MENQKETGSIVPNPASSFFQLKNVEGALEMYDVAGRLALQVPDAKQGINIDISALAKGIYYIKVKSACVIFGSKLLIV